MSPTKSTSNSLNQNSKTFQINVPINPGALPFIASPLSFPKSKKSQVSIAIAQSLQNPTPELHDLKEQSVEIPKPKLHYLIENGIRWFFLDELLDTIGWKPSAKRIRYVQKHIPPRLIRNKFINGKTFALIDEKTVHSVINSKHSKLIGKLPKEAYLGEPLEIAKWLDIVELEPKRPISRSETTIKSHFWLDDKVLTPYPFPVNTPTGEIELEGYMTKGGDLWFDAVKTAYQLGLQGSVTEISNKIRKWHKENNVKCSHELLIPGDEAGRLAIHPGGIKLIQSMIEKEAKEESVPKLDNLDLFTEVDETTEAENSLLSDIDSPQDITIDSTFQPSKSIDIPEPEKVQKTDTKLHEESNPMNQTSNKEPYSYRKKASDTLIANLPSFDSTYSNLSVPIIQAENQKWYGLSEACRCLNSLEIYEENYSYWDQEEFVKPSQNLGIRGTDLYINESHLQLLDEFLSNLKKDKADWGSKQQSSKPVSEVDEASNDMTKEKPVCASDQQESKLSDNTKNKTVVYPKSASAEEHQDIDIQNLLTMNSERETPKTSAPTPAPLRYSLYPSASRYCTIKFMGKLVSVRIAGNNINKPWYCTYDLFRETKLRPVEQNGTYVNLWVDKENIRKFPQMFDNGIQEALHVNEAGLRQLEQKFTAPTLLISEEALPIEISGNTGDFKISASTTENIPEPNTEPTPRVRERVAIGPYDTSPITNNLNPVSEELEPENKEVPSPTVEVDKAIRYPRKPEAIPVTRKHPEEPYMPRIVEEPEDEESVDWDTDNDQIPSSQEIPSQEDSASLERRKLSIFYDDGCDNWDTFSDFCEVPVSSESSTDKEDLLKRASYLQVSNAFFRLQDVADLFNNDLGILRIFLQDSHWLDEDGKPGSDVIGTDLMLQISFSNPDREETFFTLKGVEALRKKLEPYGNRFHKKEE